MYFTDKNPAILVWLPANKEQMCYIAFRKGNVYLSNFHPFCLSMPTVVPSSHRGECVFRNPIKLL